MSRATYGAARHRKKVRTLRKVRGFRGPAGNQWRLAQETLVRAQRTAFRDRRRRKREFRALWITRLTAACRMRGIAYSRFIYGLAEANVQINRKMLSEIAIASPTDFDAIVDIAKKHLDKSVAA
ncbi:MAG: 50S ribosomal protein L20 [Planctomycetota bacterium]|mgnify:CR=1 FL=1